MTFRVPLIIPVENQVRELDPKLLLACVAARSGFTSIIGSHRKIDLRIASLPRSIYLCKSFTIRNLRMFQIMRRLGHRIVSWDEEALIHLPPDMYYSRRLSPLTLKCVSHLFAWGEDNARLWRDYPEMQADKPIHQTGNPRADLLRPELRPFYEGEAEQIRRAQGDFILVNTNFNHVNGFFPSQNLFLPLQKTGQSPAFGKAAQGMTREFAQVLQRQKQALFSHFKAMIPQLEQTFPGVSIVVRPHPTENQEAYREIASRCGRVRVSNEGNVVPWLMAARAIVHNGCTTAVEAYRLGTPAISYRPRVSEEIDQGFYALAHRLSHQCFDFQQLQETLEQVLDGRLGILASDENETLLRRYMAAGTGPLASERIVDVLEGMIREGKGVGRSGLGSELSGSLLANGRRLVKCLKAYVPGSHAPPEFHRHRYPGIALGELRRRLAKMQQVLGDDTRLKVAQLYDQVFRIQC